jgi:hypothetical protein
MATITFRLSDVMGLIVTALPPMYAHGMRLDPVPFGATVAILVGFLYMAASAAIKMWYPHFVPWGWWCGGLHGAPLPAIPAGVIAYFIRRRWP